jgi:hypothetical protein
MRQIISISWGQAPKPPWFRFAEGLGPCFFCEAEQRFLLLFLEKEECGGG